MPHNSKDFKNQSKKISHSTSLMSLSPGGKEVKQQNQVPFTWSFLQGGNTHPIK
jgi:hypothetical protein